MRKKNANLKSGKFKEKEMELYEVKDKYIQSVLEYQDKLPILQQDDIKYVEGRTLFAYAGYEEAKHYTTWIKRKLKRVSAEENEEYFANHKNVGSSKDKLEYHLTLDCAKDIMMTEKGILGKITRDYFKAMEHMALLRQEWNNDRYITIEMFHELTSPLSVNKKELARYIAHWAKGNVYMSEMNMLNNIIIGMSAKEYRAMKNINKSEPIRNTFTDYELYLVHKLEEYDAILIDVQNIFNINQRQDLLQKYYDVKLMNNKKQLINV